VYIVLRVDLKALLTIDNKKTKTNPATQFCFEISEPVAFGGVFYFQG